MKKGLFSISFSGAKEQAITYRNGSTVAIAKHPRKIVLKLSNNIDCQDFLIFIFPPLIQEPARVSRTVSRSRLGFPERSPRAGSGFPNGLQEPARVSRTVSRESARVSERSPGSRLGFPNGLPTKCRAKSRKFRIFRILPPF